MAVKLPGEKNILNLDALIPDPQFVVLKGEQHEVKTPTLEMYLKVMKSRRNIRNADSDLDQMEMSIQLIKMSCPSISAEVLENLPMQAINALGELIHSLMEDQTEDAEAGSDSDAGE